MGYFVASRSATDTAGHISLIGPFSTRRQADQALADHDTRAWTLVLEAANSDEARAAATRNWAMQARG